MIVFHDCIQGTKEWFELRKDLWTGSKAIRLLQGKHLKDDSPLFQSDAMKRGTLLEVSAIREYERMYKCKVQRPGFITNTVYPNAGYSPDGIDGPWLLECKALLGFRHEELIFDRTSLDYLDQIIISQIPLQYKVQIFFGMIITGKRKARLLAFNPDFEEQLVVIEIGYDKLIGNNIRKKLNLDLKKRNSPR